MTGIETAAIRLEPAKLTREIMKSASVQAAERLNTERVEYRKKSSENDKNRKG